MSETIEIRKGYKVFNGKRTLRPATSAALQRIRYYPNRWVQQQPDHGAFAVFISIEQAQDFLRQGYGNQIRAVDYIPSTETTLWKKNPPSFSRNRYGKGYHAESNGISEKHISECPVGTQLASEIFVYDVEV